jgi:integrase
MRRPISQGVQMDILQDIFTTPEGERSKKDERQRLAYYVEWLADPNRVWYAPDMDAYRDYLLEVRQLKPSSAMAHISTIKARYKSLYMERDRLLALLKQTHPFVEGQAQFISEALDNIQKAIERTSGQIEVERDIQVFHLSHIQIDELLSKPDMSTRQGLRDVTAIGLMYCAGISETELCALRVSDLKRETDEMPAIHVPETPGSRERIVPLYDSLLFTEKWLERYARALIEVTNVSDGFIFRGFFRGGQRLNNMALTPRGVQKMLKSYPIQDNDDNEFSVTALDLRRTYARHVHHEEISFAQIHENLGNVNQRTTMEYIGLPQATRTKDNDLCDGAVLLLHLRDNWGR